VAASPVQIASVTVSQEDTKAALRNGGASAVNVSDWILGIGAFPLVLPTSQHLRVDPNETVTLHFSRGTDSDGDVYLGQAPTPLVNSNASRDAPGPVQPPGRGLQHLPAAVAPGTAKGAAHPRLAAGHYRPPSHGPGPTASSAA
jgi:hypothetical protein